MEMKPVDSSNVVAVGHDAKKNRLRVEFRDGSTYEYYEVPTAVAEDVITAPSVGGFFTRCIRGVYPHQKVA